mgnify:CR=1 FL=1
MEWTQVLLWSLLLLLVPWLPFLWHGFRRVGGSTGRTAGGEGTEHDEHSRHPQTGYEPHRRSRHGLAR